MDFGKRTLNKAQTRLDILDTVYRLSNSTNFKDLKVKSIAEEIGITEMTFFNYFQKKEDILKYMMGIWALDLLVLQHQQPLTGEVAIRRIFNHSATQMKKHPRLVVNFVASLLTSELDPTANDIEAADRFLLYPDSPELYTLRIPSGNEMLMQHLIEIDPNHDPTAKLLQLASCFYGDIIVAHTADLDLGMLYSNSLDLIFSSGRGEG
ncbi:MAG: TetR/AcrR family transcriptional regulator [Gammaproteobacteria bacterium]|nr:TetR/AcrR family transcriptional regulator [Gammaproteobacteria bacterium]